MNGYFFLVQVRLCPAHTRDVVVDHGQESLGILARYRLVMRESHCRLPKVQYHVLVGTWLVCHASEESRTHGVISQHLLYSLEN